MDGFFLVVNMEVGGLSGRGGRRMEEIAWSA